MVLDGDSSQDCSQLTVSYNPVLADVSFSNGVAE